VNGKITDKRPDLLCGTEEQQRSLALDTLQAMQSNLKFNICDFPTSHLLNEDIIDLDDRNKKHIPGYVAYSCRFWSDHLAATRYTPHVAESAHRFVANDFLFWLEALSLLRAVSFATRALSNLIGWISGVSFLPEFESQEVNGIRIVLLQNSSVTAGDSSAFLGMLLSKAPLMFTYQLSYWPPNVPR
jgi:hypothetical protein